MKIGLGRAEPGIEKRGGDAPEQAAQENWQLREKERQACEEEFCSWGTTEGGRQGSLAEHGLAAVWAQDFGQAWRWVAHRLGFLRWRGSSGLAERLP